MPPPAAATNDVFNMVYSQFVSPQVGEVTIGWAVVATTGTSVPYSDVVDQLDTNWRASGLRALASTSVTFERSRLYVIDAATGLSSQVAITANGEQQGTSTVGLAPYQAAAVCKKLTPLAGRAGRGRIYHPFLLLSALTPIGELASSFVAALNSAIVNWLGGFAPLTVGSPPNTASVAPVLLHRSELPVTSDPITSMEATGSIGTQKRRGDYGRTNRAS